MPVHDWTRVDAGIFHHFHVSWLSDLSRTLNRGLLPPDYYALAEQESGEVGPGLATLPNPGEGSGHAGEQAGGEEADVYASKARSIVIRQIDHHKVIAIVEIVSPGNKNSRHGLRAFVDKAVNVLRAGIHLVILDLLPPGPRDPQGIHKAIWDEVVDSGFDNDFTLPSGTPLTLASYIGGSAATAFVEPTAVGAVLPEMPLFLTPDVYVPLPLEATYQSAWEAVPAYWRGVLTAPLPS
jgi:hypothetical protein